MILDEPTAHLDPVTEQMILQSLPQSRRNRTTPLITHRLAGLESMDEILVLDGGRIVERGRHEALLLAGGFYRQMWDLQEQVLREGDGRGCGLRELEVKSDKWAVSCDL